MTINEKNLHAEEVKISNQVYRRLSDIPGFDPKEVNKTFFYIKIENYMNNGYDVYIRCTKGQAYNNRNLNRASEQQEISYNTHIGNKSESFFKEIYDEQGNEIFVKYADNSLNSEDIAIMNDLIKRLKQFCKDEIDCKIIHCLLNGYISDNAIGQEVGLSRSSVQERRSRLQNLFNEELSDYKDELHKGISRRYGVAIKKR